MPSPPSLAELRATLADTPLAPVSGPHREAAVAVAFAPLEAGPGVLLIERAHRPGDPWSGQIALPGGRREEQDADVVATAIRETEEEVGVTLPPAALVSRLPPIAARRRGLVTDLWVHPVAFVLDAPTPPGTSDEVAASRWVTLTELLDPRNARHHTVDVPGGKSRFPAMRLGPWILWGLTWRILDDLLRRLDHSLPRSS